MKNIVRVFVVLIIFAVCFNPISSSAQFFSLTNPNVGKPAQDFTLKLLDKEKMSLKQYVDGKNAIVFFWATWCPHCRTALVDLNGKEKMFEEQNIQLVLVNVGEQADVVTKFFNKNNIDTDVFLDMQGFVSENYQISGLPTFYFIDKKGLVRDVRHDFPKDLTRTFYVKKAEEAQKESVKIEVKSDEDLREKSFWEKVVLAWKNAFSR